MDPREFLEPTPWDSEVLGIETYELRSLAEEVLRYASSHAGHYSAKIDPLAPRGALLDAGFYYCDTLIEPVCDRARLVRFVRSGVEVTRDVALERLISICRGVFEHDRFHRDVRLRPELADARYDRWLRQLHCEGNAYAILFDGEPAAFIGLSGNRMVLHAMAREFRGRGLAKYAWSAACLHFFDQLGFDTLESSVSATNLAVVNLYASLGFRFRSARDVYHLLVVA